LWRERWESTHSALPSKRHPPALLSPVLPFHPENKMHAELRYSHTFPMIALS
jgi:hypothetical protein